MKHEWQYYYGNFCKKCGKRAEITRKEAGSLAQGFQKSLFSISVEVDILKLFYFVTIID